MSVQNAKTIRIYASLAVLLWTLTFVGTCVSARAQQTAWPHENTFQVVRGFLRATYPTFRDRRYTISIAAAVPYDDSEKFPNFIQADVGAGSKFVSVGCCFGGVTGGTLPSPKELPPEMRDQGLGQPTAQSDTPQTSSPIPHNEEIDSTGRAYPKQYLHTSFLFDQRGRIISFGANGPGIENTEANKRLNYTREMSDAEIATAIKKSGAKYGPEDKAQFVKDLPLRALEEFLEKLNLISVTFHPLREDRAELPDWPDWTVRAKATRNDGTVAEYRMTFDHVTGDLTGLCAEPHCNDLERREKLRSNK